MIFTEKYFDLENLENKIKPILKEHPDFILVKLDFISTRDNVYYLVIRGIQSRSPYDLRNNITDTEYVRKVEDVWENAY